MRSSHNINVNISTMNIYMSHVFRFMTLGLLLTAVVAYFSMQSTAFMNILQTNFFLLLGLLIAEVALVVYISARISKLSSQTATGLFLLYSALNGITIAPMLLLYTGTSIASTFFVSAGMFGVMSFYGMFTKRDLTSWGSFLIMGLIGILIATLVNFFLKSSVLASVISYLGVAIFLGLTAFDVQKLKEFGESMPVDNPTVARRGVILGAITLYLDFINIFLFLLRIMGNRSE